jgi:lysophospholipase L1-like esterase
MALQRLHHIRSKLVMVMCSKSLAPKTHESWLSYQTFLVTLILVSGAVGGFLLGRHSNRENYIEKVRHILANEIAVTSLYEVLGNALDDPMTERALAKLYQVPDGDRAALVKRLQGVVFVPSYRPAPFVGSIARPQLGDEPHINMLGFRDERQTYVTKPDKTVRIFITGDSVAWGAGASSQKQTISYILERLLNERLSGATGYRYEVINAGAIAWSTTQEKLLIQQRLVDMHPDVVIMLSGNNDVHWALGGADLRWFFSYTDLNYLTLINESYKSAGHPERTVVAPARSGPLDCSALGQVTKGNVEDAALAMERVGARLVFALQPNIVSTAKPLSQHERKSAALNEKPRWDACYQALRDGLERIGARNYRFLDLSRAFGDVDDGTEIFLDSYHFVDLGNQLIARDLVERLDWVSIAPGPAAAVAEALNIVEFSATAPSSGKLLDRLFDRDATIRVVPNRINKNLVIVLDRAVLPTTVGTDAITASIPAAAHADQLDHKIYVVDAMTGETSPPVVLPRR